MTKQELTSLCKKSNTNNKHRKAMRDAPIQYRLDETVPQSSALLWPAKVTDHVLQPTTGGRRGPLAKIEQPKKNPAFAGLVALPPAAAWAGR